MFGSGASNNVFNVQNPLSEALAENSAFDIDNRQENNMGMDDTDLLNTHEHDNKAKDRSTRPEREREREHERERGYENSRGHSTSMIQPSKRRKKKHNKSRSKSSLLTWASGEPTAIPSPTRTGGTIPRPAYGVPHETPRTAHLDTGWGNAAANDDMVEMDPKVRKIMEELDEIEQHIEAILDGFQASVKQAAQFALQSIWADVSKSFNPIREEIPTLQKIRNGVRDAEFILNRED